MTTPYRHVCPSPCDDPECAEQHPDGVVCHDLHRSFWHRTHSPEACEAMQRENLNNDDEGEAA
jgi:hypothetical protein